MEMKYNIVSNSMQFKDVCKILLDSYPGLGKQPQNVCRHKYTPKRIYSRDIL